MYYVYMLRLSDDSLYTGYTGDLNRRIKSHKAGRGSKYVKGRLPLKLVYKEKHESRRKAMQRENEIKKLSKERKENLIKKKESEF
ncbi:MAG: GIY-YIG nuclease family protein [Hadesarchaea archaeon]|nr:GIY-YIG nuclease family protein [Hadesarchaea archaeon]